MKKKIKRQVPRLSLAEGGLYHSYLQKRRAFNTLSLLLLAILVLASLPLNRTLAFDSRKDTMSRLKISQAANHTIEFTLSGTNTWAAGETLTIQFDPAGQAFNLAALSSTDPLDYDIEWSGSEKSIVANGACAVNSIEITTVNTSTDTITFTLCAGSTASAAGAAIKVEIGTHASFGGTGDSQITNPSSANSYRIVLNGTIQGTATGDLAVGITAEDQVTVTATIQASLTFTVNNTSINLGTLNPTTVSSNSSNTLVVTTNAASGYIITGLGDSPNGLVSANDNIPWVADGTVTAGASEYGAAYAGAGGHPAGDIGLASTTTVTSRSAPYNNDTTTATYKASPNTIDKPGTYQSVITYIATGTF